jgi:hypothetical protein
MYQLRVDLPVSIRLRRAIHVNDVLLVKRIIKHNPSFLENPDFDDKSNTSLHLAAILGYLDIIVGSLPRREMPSALLASSCSSGRSNKHFPLFPS